MSPLMIQLNDCREIPWLGFGTGTRLLRQDASALVANAIAHGIVHLDTAQLYENEESLGAGIALSGAPREKLFVTTKVADLPEGKTVRESFMESLARLQLDYVDLFLIHTPNRSLKGRLQEAWKELEQLQKEGLAKSIGVSNFRIQDLQEVLEVASVVPAVNQVGGEGLSSSIEYHPYVYKATKPVLEFMKKHNILPTSYGGLIPITLQKGGPVDPVLVSIRERLEKETGQQVTEGQVLGLWLRKQGIPQITTSSKLERVKEYIATESLPDLTSEEMDKIYAEGSKHHFRRYVSCGRSFNTLLTADTLLQARWIDQ
ncbi:Aldo/keto reductase [Trametes coccinea BRFM310]|uniref:Aldo/keto reductase n=1 Tax=Trametes coccinea (strain BRFM310) TaxID=1353009 RepID=A0A1Y2IU96_TRAC3|nr:Aldo/keto reductase [Trametes coccinea BRFM310]